MTTTSEIAVHMAATDDVFSYVVFWVGSGIEFRQFPRIFLLTISTFTEYGKHSKYAYILFKCGNIGKVI